MSDVKHVVVTREGLQRMKEELEYKETTENEGCRAAEGCDFLRRLGENAEYDAAKNDQAVLEQRIAELKAMIENAVVVDEQNQHRYRRLRLRVTLVDRDDPDEEEVYTIVGTSESDPMNGKLSNESPVGAALIGAHVGEIVIAQTPGGARRLKVIEIAL
ncbi:MAG: GreA/GreB family elongation factor [Christensenellales bacterium]